MYRFAATQAWLGFAGFTLAPVLARLWRTRRRFKTSRRLVTSPLISTNAPRLLRVAHMSDLHLTRADSSLLEGGDSPNRAFRSLWERSAKEMQGVDYVLTTGDITDTGAGEEWAEFMSYVEELRPQCIIAPGNHDLNIVGSSRWLVAPVSAPSQTLRMLRVIAAIDAIQGRRALLLERGKMVPLSTYLRRYRECLARFADEAPRPRRAASIEKLKSGADFREAPVEIGYPLVAKVWNDIFPHVIEDHAAKVAFIVLNTNRLAGNIVENAFGALDDGQLERLRTILRSYGGWRVVVLGHHHLALPSFPEQRLKALMSRFMVLANASEVISLLTGEPRKVVFHGHRHIGFCGTVDSSLQIIASASTSMGDELTNAPPRIRFYDLLSWGACGVVAVNDPAVREPDGRSTG